MASHIGRRKFLATLGGAVAAWPLAAHGEKAKRPVIGFLNAASAGPYAHFVSAFQRGLGETGYVEGHNVDIEYRWAEGHNDRLPGLAAGLVRRQVSVIAVPGSTPGALAAKAATTTIPIVFGIGADPVSVGLVNSLGHPGGNVTGVTLLAVELGPKHLELLHELVPTATIMGVLINPTSPAMSATTSRELQAASDKLGLRVHLLRASTDGDFDPVFATLAQLRAGGLVIGSDSFFTSRLQRLAELSARHSIPAVYWSREYVAVGGLLSYGTSYVESYRQAGVYVGRILNGEKPSELPVEQASRIELYINLKAARALGLIVPPTLLARADEVIE
jgi:putative tryptophan/tyrosine transport system substrate-binding protein